MHTKAHTVHARLTLKDEERQFGNRWVCKLAMLSLIGEEETGTRVHVRDIYCKHIQKARCGTSP